MRRCVNAPYKRLQDPHPDLPPRSGGGRREFTEQRRRAPMDRTVQFYSEGIPVVGILGLPDDYKPGEKRAAVIFCHGFTGVKEMMLPKNAERLRAEGYLTLNFDYRYFGESGGEPRSRL